ncbi:hypothetical protein BCR44DRAFT_1222052 [Catenaria anguillulae PL171]|uniref:Uncharacterized protein n=1 Tax=Catenaria anguillulae PL171 TaxID=765915 RepID=A0A1Y2HZU2_9FUNG|nr:hypothetical protein BCR44DRAFT_1222052 [Catenaria anguillulae PL171]
MSGQSYSPQLLMLAAVLVASATSAAVTSTLVSSRAPTKGKGKAAGKRAAAAQRAAVAFQSPPASPTKSAGSGAGAGSGSDKSDESGSESDDDMDDLQYETQYIQDAEPDQYNYGESERSQQADIAGHYDDLDESMYEQSRPKGEGDDKEDEDEVPVNKLKFVTVSEVWSPHEYRWMIIKNYNKDAPHDRRLAFMAHRRIVTSPGSEPVTKLFLRVLSQPLIKVLQATVPPDDRLYEKVPFIPVSNVYTAKSKLEAWLEGRARPTHRRASCRHGRPASLPCARATRRCIQAAVAIPDH